MDRIGHEHDDFECPYCGDDNSLRVRLAVSAMTEERIGEVVANMRYAVRWTMDPETKEKFVVVLDKVPDEVVLVWPLLTADELFVEIMDGPMGGILSFSGDYIDEEISFRDDDLCGFAVSLAATVDAALSDA